ncbi:imidazole glycerol phosphate synthase subunit HisH [Deinococcus cellulosilyticus]|uniref:Imidazole glycerol phosphate synthase subunit HisH n=1 Tax=Deinococcus cellulosilyticus (strain DSM 18568 / NBRC 106333 / KACC 11606 / 5516J-15) TaxID=1223518 RepID=A0A511N916_DEIC1|nr:imidazole glycerol phosphate synthase subunit HisH [Deinococcus cellulosilyticus]GEM48978.1 imidazole glycerol phosphate synthase subunit HisH [Deinococcus cellulosilyticus NBRC 106333 = KACC 11606]
MTSALLVDYGSGNLRSAAKALERAGFEVKVSSTPQDVETAQSIVIPGQGHFGQVMTEFKQSGFEGPIREALQEGLPILGICVGMQLLFEGSEESSMPGLGLLPGFLKKFPKGYAVPQMQWNTLQRVGDCPILEGLTPDAMAYFVHSYYVPEESGVQSGALTDYGVPFWSVVSQGNLHGTQFHPEKSQAVGLQILQNFRALVEAQAPVSR